MQVCVSFHFQVAPWSVQSLVAVTCPFQIANGDEQLRGDLEDKTFKASGSFCSAVVGCMGSAYITGIHVKWVCQYDDEQYDVVHSKIVPVKLL